MSINVHTALTEFHHKFLEQYQELHKTLPVIEHDPQWLSPCEQGEPQANLSFWQPVSTTHASGSGSEPELDFSGLEGALELTLHPDIKMFYTSFFSDNLPARCTDGDLELLQVWNSDDFERLQENMIGHIMAKRRKRQPETFFIGVTDDDEIIITVLNATGEVWAERVGQNPHRKLADSVATFITQLTPNIPEVSGAATM